jgi:ribonucleoside-diphosphate reductase alpha chain
MRPELPHPAEGAGQAGAEAGSASLATRNSQLGTAPRSGATGHPADALKELVDLGDAPTCSFCGAIMTRNGSCYRCMSCGSTSGCS